MKDLLIGHWVLLILSCIPFNVNAQIHNLHYWDHWQLGDQVSVSFPNGQFGTAQFDGTPHRESTRATICDPLSGDVLFSYESDSIRGADDLVIPNGGLSGFSDWSHWIAHPGDAKTYYLFAKSIGGTVGWHFTTVRTNSGILASEASVGLGPYSSLYGMDAISSPDGTTVWVVTHDKLTDAFRSYRIASPLGLDTVPTIQHIGPQATIFTLGHYIRVSPDNTRLALTSQSPGWVAIYDVDPTLGVLSDPMKLPFTHEVDGAEFSPNSRYLYVWGGQPKNIVTQIDLAAGDSAAILQSAVVLPLDTNRFKRTPRLGTDGRIYIPMDVVGLSPQADRYARILDPDQPGLACNIDTAGLVFPNYSHDPLVWNYWPFTPSYMTTPEYRVAASNLRAWPVPATDAVTIDAGVEMEKATACWTDATGRTVRAEIWPAHTRTASFDRGSLQAGSYIVEIRSAERDPLRAKVILE